MSQEKVNRYKEEKANRQKNLKKEKRKSLIAKIAAGVVCLAVVGWIGYSAINTFGSTVRSSHEVVTTAVDEYLDSVNVEE